MTLWILSQDEENFVKVNKSICLHYADKTMIIADYCDYGNGEYYELLGKYKSKERAKEVLEEIKDMMSIKCEFNGRNEVIDLQLKALMVGNMVKVFEMPKD